MRIRRRIFRWFKSGLPEGQMLSWQLMIIHWALFPIRTLRWELNKGEGFDWQRGVWTIHGMKYTDTLFEAFAKGLCIGESFKIVKRDDYITIEKLNAT